MTDRKSLPRDPTPAMIEAAERVYFRGYGWTDEEWATYLEKAGPAEREVTHEILRSIIVAAHDAAPSPLPLKRTPAPSEPGWYWGRIPPDGPVVPWKVRVYPFAQGDRRLGFVVGGYIQDLDVMHWYGAIPIPEVEP